MKARQPEGDDPVLPPAGRPPGGLGPDWNYPIHLGVTEAGEGEDGRIKSAIGIGFPALRRPGRHHPRFPDRRLPPRNRRLRRPAGANPLADRGTRRGISGAEIRRPRFCPPLRTRSPSRAARRRNTIDRLGLKCGGEQTSGGRRHPRHLGQGRPANPAQRRRPARGGLRGPQPPTRLNPTADFHHQCENPVGHGQGEVSFPPLPPSPAGGRALAPGPQQPLLLQGLPPI